MSMSIKKRLVLGSAAFTTVAAAATLVAGVTFGLFTSSAGPQNNTFSTGTVSIGQDVSSTPCAIVHAVPGDSGTCTFVVKDASNVPAYIGLTTSSSNTAPDLALSISDGTNSYGPNGTDLFVAADSGAATFTFTVSWSLPLTAGNGNQGKSATVNLTAVAVQQAHNGDGSTCVAGSACAAAANGVLSWS